MRLLIIWLFSLVYLAVTIWCKMSLYYVSILSMPMAITYVPYEERIKDFILKHSRLVWCFMLFSTVTIMGYSVVGQYLLKLPGWGLPVNILLPWLIVYVTYYLGGWKNKLTNFLGQISYEFYIIHGFIVMQIGECHLFGLTGYLNAFLIIAVAFLITVLCAWALSEICAKVNDFVLKF